MTYNVFGGTLSLTQPINFALFYATMTRIFDARQRRRCDIGLRIRSGLRLELVLE